MSLKKIALIVLIVVMLAGAIVSFGCKAKTQDEVLPDTTLTQDVVEMDTTIVADSIPAEVPPTQ